MNYCGYHTHTTFSDGKNSMEEMVLAANSSDGWAVDGTYFYKSSTVYYAIEE